MSYRKLAGSTPAYTGPRLTGLQPGPSDSPSSVLPTAMCEGPSPASAWVRLPATPTRAVAAAASVGVKAVVNSIVSATTPISARAADAVVRAGCCCVRMLARAVDIPAA